MKKMTFDELLAYDMENIPFYLERHGIAQWGVIINVHRIDATHIAIECFWTQWEALHYWVPWQNLIEPPNNLIVCGLFDRFARNDRGEWTFTGQPAGIG